MAFTPLSGSFLLCEATALYPLAPSGKFDIVDGVGLSAAHDASGRFMLSDNGAYRVGIMHAPNPEYWGTPVDGWSVNLYDSYNVEAIDWTHMDDAYYWQASGSSNGEAVQSVLYPCSYVTDEYPYEAKALYSHHADLTGTAEIRLTIPEGFDGTAFIHLHIHDETRNTPIVSFFSISETDPGIYTDSVAFTINPIPPPGTGNIRYRLYYSFYVSGGENVGGVVAEFNLAGMPRCDLNDPSAETEAILT